LQIVRIGSAQDQIRRVMTRVTRTCRYLSSIVGSEVHAVAFDTRAPLLARGPASRVGARSAVGRGAGCNPSCRGHREMVGAKLQEMADREDRRLPPASPPAPVICRSSRRKTPVRLHAFAKRDRFSRRGLRDKALGKRDCGDPIVSASRQPIAPPPSHRPPWVHARCWSREFQVCGRGLMAPT
jgi:hypothetical protein